MIRTLPIVLFLMVAFISNGQKKQFVCTPCGETCDNTVLDHDGNCSACGMALVDKSTVAVKNLTVDEICNRIAANPDLVLLDVRSPREFDGSASNRRSFGSFRNAININIDQLESRANELTKYKDKEIIVYCSHSHRSPRATYLLSTLGFTNVSNMAGGVSTLAGQKDNECLKKNFVFH